MFAFVISAFDATVCTAKPQKFCHFIGTVIFVTKKLVEFGKICNYGNQHFSNQLFCIIVTATKFHL